MPKDTRAAAHKRAREKAQQERQKQKQQRRMEARERKESNEASGGTEFRDKGIRRALIRRLKNTGGCWKSEVCTSGYVRAARAVHSDGVPAIVIRSSKIGRKD